MINLYSKNEVKKHGQQQVRVPVYKVTVTNESGSSSEFLYTRYNLRANIGAQNQIEDRTFDINAGVNTFEGVIKSRWSGSNNVLEVRVLGRDNFDDQYGVIGMRGDKADVERVAIQFHVLGASDGCLLAVGSNALLKGSPIKTSYPTSTAAQTAFMSKIMEYRKEDVDNDYSKIISISFDRLHNNPYYRQEQRGTLQNIPASKPIPFESSLQGIQ